MSKRSRCCCRNNCGCGGCGFNNCGGCGFGGGFGNCGFGGGCGCGFGGGCGFPLLWLLLLGGCW